MTKGIRFYQVAISLAGVAILALLLGVAWRMFSPHESEEEKVADNAPAPRQISIPAPPRARSDFLNTRADTRYVGTSKCRECHQCHPNQHATYQQTAHSRALSETIPGDEPPSQTVFHELSGRKYTVLRQAGKLWHREILVNENGTEIPLGDYPLKYVTGSGRFSKTYLVERDGFLVESPLTWYSDKERWGMSPGYDTPSHPSFRRLISWECLYCHAGGLELSEESHYRYRIAENSIGCERCHGPGSLHAERWAAESPSEASAIDRTIVNPKHLPRDLAEAICQQCHLNGDTQAAARGVSWHEFRPGLPLSDFRHEYRLGHKSKEMSVVGHVEQLHNSRCYQMSDAMTCTTCHQMHGGTEGAYRPETAGKTSCLKCHAEDSCTETPEARRHVPEAEACVACHMPAVDTDLPHFAFRHHRIGIYRTSPEPAPKDIEPGSPLVPLQDLSRFSQLDRDRSLGLAMWQYYTRNSHDARYQIYRDWAKPLLEGARQSGLRDADIEAALGQIYADEGRLLDALPQASRALAMPAKSPHARITALYIQGQGHMAFGELDQAVKTWTELTRLRRDPTDWAYLGICEQRRGNLREAARAFEYTLKIDPGQSLSHRQLHQLYTALGEPAKAEHHRKRAEILPLTGFQDE